MQIKCKHLGILGLLLAMPLLVVGMRAVAYQGGEPGGQRGERGRAPMSPDERLKRMTQNFNLTPDQQEKIKPILVDSQKQMEDLRSNSDGDRRAMRGQMMKIMQNSNDQIRAVLDDKQKEAFDKMEKERRERMQNRRGAMHGTGGPGGQGGDDSGPPPQH